MSVTVDALRAEYKEPAPDTGGFVFLGVKPQALVRLLEAPGSPGGNASIAEQAQA